MPRPLHYHPLDPADCPFLVAAITELTTRLAAEDIPLDAAPLPDDLAPDLLAPLAVGHNDGALDALHRAAATHPAGAFGLLVYCHPDAPCARTARKRLPHALWGINYAGRLSLAYAPGNKYLLWHEALHLLGAQDHYRPDYPAATCELPACLMQYAPTNQTVGDSPMICRQTRAILTRAR